MGSFCESFARDENKDMVHVAGTVGTASAAAHIRDVERATNSNRPKRAFQMMYELGS